MVWKQTFAWATISGGRSRREQGDRRARSSRGGRLGPSHAPRPKRLRQYPVRMDQTAFYGVVTTINFTLLGLWWLAAKDRVDLFGRSAATRRTAYLVSLQFAIPATVSLLAQVAPEE